MKEETGKYRRPGEPTNAKCADCEKDIWMRISCCSTVYHGQENGHLYMHMPAESFNLLMEGRTKTVCPKCWHEKYEGEKNG